ncbi:MAG TPA: RNA polymerase sigma factor [Thermomicrobiales bacterium]|nr:RNA polymerase sigma factor [Thermomicrobiales bacterium]
MMSAVLMDEPKSFPKTGVTPFAVEFEGDIEDVAIGTFDGSTTAVEESISFSSVIERFGTEIYRFSWHLARNQADADDLYQETLFKAFRAFDRLPADANHRAWLYRIASNTFISDRRKRSREHALTDVIEQTATTGAPDHARGLDARDLLGDVERFVRQLPPKQRIALVMRKYQGAEYAQIAEALDCSEVAARANVHEALRKLKSQFAHRLES